eukprot:6558240-Pyramimonas_sp.AAC.1
MRRAGAHATELGSACVRERPMLDRVRLASLVATRDADGGADVTIGVDPRRELAFRHLEMAQVTDIGLH